MPIETTDSRVEAVIDSRFQVTSTARGHATLTDEPEDIGGADVAMDPTELFLSSLASCKLATMRMVAERKAWNTTGMKIVLTLEKETDPAVKNAEKTIIRQTISFPGHLTEEQRAKLTAISHKCPVSKIVTGEVHIIDND
jgi:putative redox protein